MFVFSTVSVAQSLHVRAGLNLANSLITVEDEKDIDIGTDPDEDDIKPFDYGLNVGLGVEYMGFQLGGTYGLGFANLLVEPEDGFSWKNRVIQIHLSYRILD